MTDKKECNCDGVGVCEEHTNPEFFDTTKPILQIDESLFDTFNAGYGGCTCECHRNPDVVHIAPCCYPSDDEVEVTADRPWAVIPEKWKIENDAE